MRLLQVGNPQGMFLKLGNLTKDQLGIIELKRDCAFVARCRQTGTKLIIVILLFL